MNLYEFADIIDADIECRRYANQDDRWLARFDGCETKKDSMLEGTYGSGASATQALNDYVKDIRGKRLVFNAMSETIRREYVCPIGLREVDG